MAKGATLADLPLFSLFRAEPAAVAVQARAMADEIPLPQTDAAQAKMEFLLRLRARGISDVNVLRALEIIPRESFAPHRYRDLALRDVALPIGCGQTMQEPLLVARMIEALRVEPGHKVLEIGAGSGYASAVLARLAADVTSVERFQSLVTAARTRLDALGISNVSVVQADGLALPPDLGPFDRILVHGRLDTLPESLIGLLAEGGSVVAGLMSEGASRIVRWRHGPDGLMQDAICEGRLQRLIPGVAAAL
jgi:protein-L-isoaspartate(D-aspartate) O-methyltransferase